MLGVALGRVKEKTGVSLINFHPACCVQQPDVITSFYDKSSLGLLLPDLSCCKTPTPIDSETKTEDNVSLIDNDNDCDQLLDDDDLDDDTIIKFCEAIEAEIVEEEFVDIPNDFNIEECIAKSKFLNNHTSFQLTVNTSLDDLYTNKRQDFLKFIGLEIDSIVNIMKEHLEKPKVQQKDESAAYSSCYEHSISAIYKQRCCSLFGEEQLSDEQWNATYRVCTYIRSSIVSKTADAINMSRKSVKGKYIY